MCNTTYKNVRNGKLPFPTFSIFGIVLSMSVIVTWWLTRNHYKTNDATETASLRLDSSLINCSSSLKDFNRLIFREMDERLKDPARREKALLWNPKANSALILTQNTQQYVQEIKTRITGSGQYTESGGRTSSFYESQIFNELFDTINIFNTHLIGLIPSDKIRQLSILPTQALVSNMTNNRAIWAETYFKHLSKNSIVAMLSKIEIDILRSTNIILNYMNDQNERLIHYNEFLLPLVSQNSMIFLPGQTLEVTAGLGVYSSMTNPKIEINDKLIQVNEYGTCTYRKIINSNKSGSVPIVVTYKDPNTGELRTLSKSITYTVFQPSKD